MKEILLSLLLICFVLTLSAQNRAERIREKLLTCNNSSVLVVAHRGDWRYAPENSLPAIDNAIKMGVDIVELDLQRTKDGVLIIMHDATLERTTTGTGKIADWTLDSIRTLKLRNGCWIKTKEVVPTLEEALLHIKGRVMVNLDKADRYFEQVVEIAHKTGTAKQIIMKGRKSPADVHSFYGDYLGDIIYMPIVDLDKKNAQAVISSFVNELSPVAFELLFVKDTNPLPVKLKTDFNGKTLIWYNTLWDTMAGGHDDDMSLDDPDKGYGYLIDSLGARIIQTDRPAYLIEYLKGRGLHD